MPDSQRKLAVVTGASTGIGLELARECAKNEFDLLIAANESELESAADELRREGGAVDTVQADLATTEGVDQLYGKIGGRPVAALLANAGRGLGHPFLDQDFKDARYVVDTNVTGTTANCPLPPEVFSGDRSDATYARWRHATSTTRGCQANEYAEPSCDQRRASGVS
jgi:short-subunit dehydrogenase